MKTTVKLSLLIMVSAFACTCMIVYVSQGFLEAVVSTLVFFLAFISGQMYQEYYIRRNHKDEI